MGSGTTDDTWGVGPEPIAIVGIGEKAAGFAFLPSTDQNDRLSISRRIILSF